MSARGTVLVTGTSTGIGRATALHLATLGFHVLAGVRREADGAALGPAVEPVLCDVTDAAQVRAVAEAVGDGGLAGLVNNAGIVEVGPVELLDLDRLRRALEVNVVSHVAVTQALLPALRTARGRIVNVGSIGGRMAMPFASPYSTSKAALRSMTDSLRQELRPQGVRVSLVEPGAIATEIWRKGDEQAEVLGAGMDAETMARYGDRVAGIRRLSARTARHAVAPERVAKVIAHALTAQRPRAHHLVGVDARLQNLALKLGPAFTDRALALAMRV